MAAAFSTILSLIILMAFGLFLIYIGEGHGEASEADVGKATPIQQEKAMLIKIEESVWIDAPHIQQLPELPRGCEVTSLAMLLGSAGVHVDKMKLAEEVKKIRQAGPSSMDKFILEIRIKGSLETCIHLMSLDLVSIINQLWNWQNRIYRDESSIYRINHSKN
ncbi:C39 family peptidase [Bacillus sp. N9]